MAFVWGSSKVHLTLFLQQSEGGTTPAALSFLKVRRAQTSAVLFRSRGGRAAAPSPGSLSSAAKGQQWMYIPSPRRQTCWWCWYFVSYFLFSVLVSTTLVLDTDKTGQQFPFSTGNNTEVAFLSAGQQVLTGLAQHFTLASAIITRSLMPRALSTALTSRDPLLQWTISHLFHCQTGIYTIRKMVSVVSLDFILPRHTSGPSPSLSVIIV